MCLLQDQHPMIRFRTNPRKALEVILWFANRQPGIGKHALLKLLFFADKWHLNRYGRPIVGDEYRAMPYGPVAMTTYDILNRHDLALEALGMEDIPVEVRHQWRVHAQRPADMKMLSESDIEALEWAFQTYGCLSFNELTRASHQDPAYANADGRIRYEDFLEESEDREQRAADLAEISTRLAI